MVKPARITLLIGAPLALSVAAGCSEIGDTVLGDTAANAQQAGLMTAAPAPSGPYAPADVNHPTIRQAANAAAGRIYREAAVIRIYSAEATAASDMFIRMQLELADQSIWEAVVAQTGDAFQVVRLERIG